MFGLSPFEIAIIGGIALLLFGGSQLPKLARGIGQSAVEFRRGLRELEQAGDDLKKIDGK